MKADLIADFRTVDDAAKAEALGFPNPFTQVDWTFVLARSEETPGEAGKGGRDA